MTALVEMVDLRETLAISREELDGFRLMFSEYKESNPIKMTYDNICVHEFNTDMKANPRPIFSTIIDVADEYIDAAISQLDKDCMVVLSEDSWRIKTRFVIIDICLHCYSEYDQGDFVFEDVATHRVVVSMTASFDTKYMYGADEHNSEVFNIVNQFYASLKRDLSK